MGVHERAAAGLQAEVARSIAAAPRKEVLLFVHGYANTFQDAAFSMADLCHLLRREFGEFAVQHLKQAIRLIAQSPDVERFKVENIVLLAPDIDADVAAAKIFGRLDVALLTKEQAAKAVRLAYLVDFIEVEGTPGFLAHSYRTSDPAVRSDLIAMIRYGLAPGAPGRPLEEIQRPFWRIPARP